MKQKVLAYITHQRRLLVFRHTQFPEAGIQVPGGTVEVGEPLEQAVLREAQEETGLQNLQITAYLGSEVNRFEGVSVERHYFHLEPEGEVPDTWLSYEMDPSDGTPAPIEFEFFWVSLPNGVPELAGGQGAMVNGLPVFLGD